MDTDATDSPDDTPMNNDWQHPREEELRAVVRSASRIAEEAGEMRSIVLPRILDELLAGGMPRNEPLAEAATQTKTAPRRKASRQPAKAPSLDRIRPMLDASPEVFVKYAAGIARLADRFKAYRVLQFGRNEFKIERLNLAEMRVVLNERFRAGVVDNSLRARLSTAPAAELYRSKNASGELEYMLTTPGEAALEASLEKHGGPGSDE